MEKLIDFFKDIKIKAILDVGTGTGDFVTVLKEVFSDAEITGVDPNTESLIQAKERYLEVTFKEMSAEKLNFENSIFDLASISMALHHVPDVKKSLTEIQRVVKPNGWIVVNELFSDNLNEAQETHKMYHHFRSKIDRLIGISHNETFKKEEIIEMVRDSGIDIKQYFENSVKSVQHEDAEILEERIEKMKLMLEKIKHFPEYERFKPEIKIFRERVLKYGFLPPPRVVIVGQTR